MMVALTLRELALLTVLGIVWTAAVALLTPRVLLHGTWWHRLPQVALFTWWAALFAALGGVVVAGVAGALSLGLVAMSTESAPTQAAAEVILVLTAVILVAAVSYAIGRSERHVVANRVVRRNIDTLIRTRAASIEQRTGYELVVLDAAEPVAFSVRGRSPRIVLSEGLASTLTPAELSAVIWHERGHLESRHDVVIGSAALVAHLLPWSRNARQFAAAVHLLTELAADRVAVDRVSCTAVAAAMDRLRVAEGAVRHLT